MDMAYSLGAKAPMVKKFVMGATVSYAGTPILAATAGNPGCAQATTTAAAKMLGCNLDLTTAMGDPNGNKLGAPPIAYSTTQLTGGNAGIDEQVVVTVVINPDAVWKAKLSGAAAEDTALPLQLNTTTSTGGTVVTTGAAWNSPTYVDGIVWGFDGANAALFRKLTSAGGTSGTVTVPFPNTIAIGDNFLRAPAWPGTTQTVTLTTNLFEVRTDVAVATNTAALRCVELLLRDTGLDGRNASYTYVISADHAFANT